MGLFSRLQWVAIGLALALPVSLSGCQTNPATGRQVFTGLMPESQEANIGRQYHDEIVKEFGGAYSDPAIQSYVQSLVDRIATTTERPDLRYQVTVLDSPIVNAMALPGGYLYVTRGLMTLANGEAELAGVLAHEIGHVAARHSAERQGQSVLANLGLMVLGAATGNRELVQGGQLLSAGIIQSYSREQEFEADMLGIRYMTRTGYVPDAMASFLRSLSAEDELTNLLRGRPSDAQHADFLASHPRTLDRVQRALQEAAAHDQPPHLPADPWVHDDYLRRLDGMIYGDRPEEGLIKGRNFIHPEFGFAFEVPQGFHMTNLPDAVVAEGPQGAVIVFDRAKGSRLAPREYLQTQWARGRPLQSVETLNINGMPAATGVTDLTRNGRRYTARLVAIRFQDGNLYRFLFAAAPARMDQLSEPFRRTTYSFRPLDPQEAGNVRPYRIDIITAKTGDTIESLARELPFETYQAERFRLLNGLLGGEQVRPGMRLKTIRQ